MSGECITGSGDMLDNPATSEDLKAFERRLAEILACYQVPTKRWRIILLISTLTTVIAFAQWRYDMEVEKLSILESLHNHLFFSFNCIIIISLFMIGIHKKVVAPTIIVSRIKSVLENFNMSCDHNGRLILKRSRITQGSSSINTSSTPGRNGIWSANDAFRNIEYS